MSNSVDDLKTKLRDRLSKFCESQKDLKLYEEDFFKPAEDLQEKLTPQQYLDYCCIRNAVLFESVAMSVNCNVHGFIDLHIALKKIIDTPQFQRLRRLRQLATVHFVYPTAMHTRFEHSIGVSYLAGQLANRLAEIQPEFNITKKDILCVKIAGLCHDLGHGPFSHTFERFVKSKGGNWNHEQASCKLFDDIIRENDQIRETLKLCGFDDSDFIFIKEMIAGIGKDSSSNDWQQKGRPREKGFLYEIVANNRCGLDVDKLDYLARDSLNLGLSLVSANFDHKRIIHLLRVSKEGEDFVLCTPDKQYISILKMFELRRQLFLTAYLHKTVVAVECMLLDAMLKADDHIITQNKIKEDFKLSEIWKDMEAYCQLDDETLLSRIRTSNVPELKDSRDLLHRIECRNLYTFIGEKIPNYEQQPSCQNKKYDKKIVLQALQNLLQDEDEKESIDVVIGSANLGMGDVNPVDFVKFTFKRESITDVKIKRLLLKPSEQLIRLYSKHSKADINQPQHKKLIDTFNKWWENEEKTELTGNSPEIKKPRTI